MVKKTKIGLVEEVEICGKRYKARVDTGAERSSIDEKLASKLKHKENMGTVSVISASGRTKRKLVKFLIKVRKRKIRASFNVADRKKMRYRILIGRNILKMGFLIDCSK